MKAPKHFSPHRMVAGIFAATLMAGMSAPALATPLIDAITAAEQQFGGEAFEAERYREDGRTRIEVEVLSGNQIVEVLFNGRATRVLDVDTSNNRRKVARVSAALERADLSLAEATEIAEDAIGPGQVREAELRVSRDAERNGKRFVIEVRNDDGLFDAVVNSRNGRVIRIRPD